MRSVSGAQFIHSLNKYVGLEQSTSQPQYQADTKEASWKKSPRCRPEVTSVDPAWTLSRAWDRVTESTEVYDKQAFEALITEEQIQDG